MSIEWTKSLETGVPRIDQQHRELFRRFNAMAKAMMDGKGQEKIEKLFDFLGKYVVEHFADEERFMEEYDCPIASVNRHEHEMFAITLKAFKDRLTREGSSTYLLVEIQRTLTTWLLNHVGTVDKQLGTYVAATRAPSGCGL